ncbi:sulfoquinovosidase-like [Branchiostoma floridae x Branchiostoma belcheri]
MAARRVASWHGPKLSHYVLLWTVLFTAHCRAFTVRQTSGGGVDVLLDGTLLLRHQRSDPAILVGSGTTVFRELHGNFNISDTVGLRVALPDVDVTQPSPSEYRLVFSSGGNYQTEMTLMTGNEGHDHVMNISIPGNLDRTWLRLYADDGEHVYGGGEQFTYFDLRGRSFPIWTREQGVGRQPGTFVTDEANRRDGGGGDYHTTYWPQPTFVSSRRYFCHFTTTDYMIMDFTDTTAHVMQMWGSPGLVHFGAAATFPELSEQLGALLGKQPELPDWVYDGAILGVQGGTSEVLRYLEQAEGQGVKVNALWIQDWAGRIRTSFGRRLFWNWVWDENQYPGLREEIVRQKERGVRFLGYINPHLNKLGNLYAIADSRGYFVKNSTGQTYIQDFGEFFCGTIDLTNPAAFQWYKNEVIIKNMIELGLAGWMADFGEYLPPDMVFYNGVPGREMHNHYPALWAKANRDAVEESGKLGEIVFWMRAGFSGSQNYSVMSWAGDQFVDYSLGDGLASVIPAALSLGVSGYGLSHFDIGGFTSLFGITRTEELLLRYAEMAVFTPMMRTHEGNRPSDNWQVYSSDSTLQHFARLVDVHVSLAGYIRELVQNNSRYNLPVQSPLFYHYPDDPMVYSIKYQYLFGPDALIAPVYREGVDTWQVYLPQGHTWVHLWSDNSYEGGQTVTVDAPLGQTPFFFRESSRWASLFRTVARDNPPVSGTSLSSSILPYITAIVAIPLFFWFRQH